MRAEQVVVRAEGSNAGRAVESFLSVVLER